MVDITVYGKPGCPQCYWSRMRLLRAKVPHSYRDVTEDEAAYDTVKLLGYQSLPVVTAGDVHWSGLKEELLARVIELHEQEDIGSLDNDAIRYLMEGP